MSLTYEPASEPLNLSTCRESVVFVNVMNRPSPHDGQCRGVVGLIYEYMY